MPISLSDLTKVLDLSEDQVQKMPDLQSAFDKVYKVDVEDQKTGLINKNQDLISKLKTAKDHATPDGFDLNGYNDYITNKDQIEADKRKAKEDKLISEQNWDKLKNDMANNHESAITNLNTSKDTEIRELRTSLDLELIENVVLKAIKKVDGSPTLLMPHLRDHIETYKNDMGKYNSRVIDVATGKERMDGKTGDSFTVEDLVSEFQAKPEFAGAFPIQNQGSNSTVNIGTTNYNSTNNPYNKESKHYSLTEQAKINRTNPKLAKQLRDQARA